jgi:hypothetical protein
VKSWQTCFLPNSSIVTTCPWGWCRGIGLWGFWEDGSLPKMLLQSETQRWRQKLREGWPGFLPASHFYSRLGNNHLPPPHLSCLSSVADFANGLCFAILGKQGPEGPWIHLSPDFMSDWRVGFRLMWKGSQWGWGIGS